MEKTAALNKLAQAVREYLASEQQYIKIAQAQQSNSLRNIALALGLGGTAGLAYGWRDTIKDKLKDIGSKLDPIALNLGLREPTTLEGITGTLGLRGKTLPEQFSHKVNLPDLLSALADHFGPKIQQGLSSALSYGKQTASDAGQVLSKGMDNVSRNWESGPKH